MLLHALRQMTLSVEPVLTTGQSNISTFLPTQLNNIFNVQTLINNLQEQTEMDDRHTLYHNTAAVCHDRRATEKCYLTYA